LFLRERKNKMKGRIILLGLIVILTLAAIPGYAQLNEFEQRTQNLAQIKTPENELISIAKTALETELSLQINGNNSIQNLNNDRFAGAMQKRFVEANEYYNENVIAGRQAKESPMKVYDEELRISKNKATLFLTAFNQITFIDSNGESFDSGGETKYRFEFEYQTNQWIMVNIADVSFDRASTKNPEKFDISSQPLFDLAAVAPTVSRNGVVTYAIRHVYNPNPAYRVFDKDCTNFVSQALCSNGWGMIWGNRESNSSWYYYGEPYSFYPYSRYQSFTWSVAHNFALFNFNQGRATKYAIPSDSNWGDVLQIDLYGDGHIDHSTIATKLDSGEVYLTYRSTDYLNRPLSYFKNNYPKAVYYGWHLYFNANEINISKISPAPVKVGQGTWLTVTGTNFRSGVTASVNQWGIANTGVKYQSSSSVLVYVVMNNRGSYTLQLKNPDGTYARKNFTVV
jgi:hypothetical protein